MILDKKKLLLVLSTYFFISSISYIPFLGWSLAGLLPNGDLSPTYEISIRGIIEHYVIFWLPLFICWGISVYSLRNLLREQKFQTYRKLLVPIIGGLQFIPVALFLYLHIQQTISYLSRYGVE